ncbi:hypothetical protein D3C79_820940 [compost metagenome]
MTSGDQQAELVQRTGGGGQCSRGGERERAWAGGYQHGQDNPERPCRVQVPPPQAYDDGGHQREQQEPLRCAVGNLRQAWLFRLRAFQQADDGRQSRLLAKGFDFYVQRAFDIQGAAGDPVAGPPRLRQVLTGQQRLVDAGAAFDNAPVSGDHRAGQHLHGVAALQFAEQDALAAAKAVQAQARGR